MLALIAVGPLAVLSGCRPATAVSNPGSSEPLTPVENTLAEVPAGQDGYAIGENVETANTGPVRLARVSYVTGPVSWRPDESTEWSNATMNMPCRQGAQVWVKSGSRAELMFDDGSVMRLGGGAVATMQTMYSDDSGEFTEVKLNDGIGTFHLRSKLSRYQIDTPHSSVKAYGPSEFRIGVADTTEVSCLWGSANVSGPQGERDLRQRERLHIRDNTTPYELTGVPESDPWDQFNEDRDGIYAHRNEHVPENISMVAGNLDNYGTWHNDEEAGYVWAPRVSNSNWRPYHQGRWVWVSPWGWTWVGEEAWGYAPYHYGTWVRRNYGWAWSPGPAVQYWSPGVVHYYDNGDSVGWAPLAPSEVRYPSSINIGFRSGNWALSFSIGGAAAYYPSSSAYCEARPWSNVYANREVNNYSVTNITNIYNNSAPGSSRVFAQGNRFVPQNGSRYAGMTTTSRAGFMSGSGYVAAQADPEGRVFRTGKSFTGAPTNVQVFGPPDLRPGRDSYSPGRGQSKASAPSQQVLQRQVVRQGVSAAISKQGAPFRGAVQPSNKKAEIVRGVTPQRGRTSQATTSTRDSQKVRPPTTQKAGPIKGKGGQKQTPPSQQRKPPTQQKGKAPAQQQKKPPTQQSQKDKAAPTKRAQTKQRPVKQNDRKPPADKGKGKGGG